MNHLIITLIALIILAGAFPDQAHSAVNLAATWTTTVLATVEPGQLTAIVLAIVLVLVVSKR